MAPLSPAPSPHGAPPPSSPTPAATQALAATPASPPASRATSTMSPSATPFFPLGRSKAQRWEDSSPSMVDLEGPPSPPPRPSYRDVVASRPVLVERGPPPAKSKPSSCRVLTSVVGHCSISLPKTKDDGWHKVENRHARRRRLLESRALRRRFPEDLLGKCSNCLSVNHRVASCMPAHGGSQHRGCNVPLPAAAVGLAPGPYPGPDGFLFFL
jgi:hypothetical protein